MDDTKRFSTEVKDIIVFNHSTETEKAFYDYKNT